MGKPKVKFNAKAFAKALTSKIVKEQTIRLVEYARKEIQRIGDDISVAPTINNLDRTGNLLDSLCWAVFYNGTLQRFGYYRNATAEEDSYLHEYSRPKGMSVNGHDMAASFIAEYETEGESGWELFFAVLAPYWGYWEKGPEHVPSNHFFQWSVMTRHYDVVKRDLAGCRVTFNNYIPD